MSGWGQAIFNDVIGVRKRISRTSSLFFLVQKLGDIRAYCMPMYACQLWIKYTQTSMKRLRAAYNNAYRIMHYIPRNVSVRPHQVSHSVRTFDAVLRTNLYRFFLCDAHLHPTFLFDRFKCLMLFANLHFSSIIQRSCMVETKRSSWP